MKELSIEEKAKAYDEALSVALETYQTQPMYKDWLKKMFPELKEPEDEKIKKLLVEAVIQVLQDQYCSNRGVPKEKVVAWIERQGGQNLTNKIEPKFHEGDWVVKGNITAQILDVQEQYYIGIDTNGNDFTSSRFLSDDKIHLWTIQDAKDGDILASDNDICIFNGILEEDKYPFAYCGITKRGFESYNGNLPFLHDDNIKPATKEQSDLLFQKMREVGYEWDAEKKELRTEETDLTEFENALADVCRGWIGEELGWKDYIIKNSLPLLELAKKQFDEYEQKCTSNSKPKFHEGDIIKPKDGSHEPWQIIQVDISDKKYRFKDGCVIHFSQEDNYELVEQNYTDWSKEDSMHLTNAILAAEKEWGTESCTSKWLKSLKDKHTWKPSDEQMDALDDVISKGKLSYINQVRKLISLYNNLKQL